MVTQVAVIDEAGRLTLPKPALEALGVPPRALETDGEGNGSRPAVVMTELVFLDANVFMDAAGAPHEYKAACVRILADVEI